MKLTLVAAVAADGGIGRNNGLLFSDVADRRHLRAVTLGKPVVMGRNTWLSLPEPFRPLPGRRNVVLSRDEAFDAPGAETARSLDEALTRLATEPEVCVLGGADVYAQAITRADELRLTEIARIWPEADTHFPKVDPAVFEAVQRTEAQAVDGTLLAFVTYRRRTNIAASCAAAAELTAPTASAASAAPAAASTADTRRTTRA